MRRAIQVVVFVVVALAIYAGLLLKYPRPPKPAQSVRPTFTSEPMHLDTNPVEPTPPIDRMMIVSTTGGLIITTTKDK